MAGTGKSTIAYSICQRVEEMGQDNRDVILAASFFCSRQIEDARRRKYIIPTIVYQLARRSRSYAKKLLDADFDTVDVSSRQMEELLVRPWDKSGPKCLSGIPPWLIVVDALDENDGGSEFLKDLLNMVHQGHLQGLKFLVTSRPDPKVVAHCDSFTPDAVCHLHEVTREDVQADILTFLRATLPDICERCQLKLEQLAEDADGLFIYAATAVRFISPYRFAPQEQEQQLNILLEGWPTMLESIEVLPVDQLYSQILCTSLLTIGRTIQSARLAILHTILCVEEPVSTSTISALLSHLHIEEDVVKHVIKDLHAVLYISRYDECIYWYHKSFFDFMCDPQRSHIETFNGLFMNLTCYTSVHHTVLVHACFNIMQSLQFNICHHPSSFLLDKEVLDLVSQIKKNIPPPLQYSSRHWVHHLVQSKQEDKELYQNIKEFCYNKSIFWIEVMNLIGAKSQCNTLMILVTKWLSQVCLIEFII